MFGLTGFLRHGSSAASTIDFVIGGDYRFTKTGTGTTTMARCTPTRARTITAVFTSTSGITVTTT